VASKASRRAGRSIPLVACQKAARPLRPWAVPRPPGPSARSGFGHACSARRRGEKMTRLITSSQPFSLTPHPSLLVPAAAACGILHGTTASSTPLPDSPRSAGAAARCGGRYGSAGLAGAEKARRPGRPAFHDVRPARRSTGHRERIAARIHGTGPDFRSIPPRPGPAPTYH
jgi:hypothetical protein